MTNTGSNVGSKMTSKEKIEYIRYFFTSYDADVKEILDDIKKDLDVLEIIKTHKLLNYVIKNDKCANMYGLSVEDKECLKEWLENDKA